MTRFPFGLCIALGACQLEDDPDLGVAMCEEVHAVANDDVSSVLGVTVLLSADASTSCEPSSTTYTWQFDQVPEGSDLHAGSFSDNGSVTAHGTSFTPDVVGTYVLSLVVVDGDAESSPDVVVVDVFPGDLAPVAQCSPQTSGEVGVDLVFDGSGSFDPEGADLDFSWVLAGVPDCSAIESGDLAAGHDAVSSLVPDCAGTYTVALQVMDGANQSAVDYCTAMVASDDQVPVADAGEGGEVVACDGSVPLSGYASYDQETFDLGYAWSLFEKPPGSLADDSGFDDPAIVAPSFLVDQDGTYTFSLQVFDGVQWSPPDLVTYDVVAGGGCP